MAWGSRHRTALLGVVLATLAGCGIDVVPGTWGMPAGSRELSVFVRNESGRPVDVSVRTANEDGTGPVVGRAEPSLAAPERSTELVLVVPPGDDWAIVLGSSVVVTAADVPAGFSGRIPAVLMVDSDGIAGVGYSGDLGPGWFGR